VGVDSDVASLADRYVTVTPLRFDLTDHSRMAEVRGWGLSL
jgi:broad specificity polyphosphatase/5'/3'-nucleotidase SurE